jgi:hypothetical protein
MKGKVFPLQAYVGPWGSDRLRVRIFSTFGTMKVVRSSPLRTGRLYPQKFSWYSFLQAESTPRAHGSVGSFGKKSPTTPLGIHPQTLRLVAQYLNHYATPGPLEWEMLEIKFVEKIKTHILRVCSTVFLKSFRL